MPRSCSQACCKAPRSDEMASVVLPYGSARFRLSDWLRRALKLAASSGILLRPRFFLAEDSSRLCWMRASGPVGSSATLRFLPHPPKFRPTPLPTTPPQGHAEAPRTHETAPPAPEYQQGGFRPSEPLTRDLSRELLRRMKTHPRLRSPPTRRIRHPPSSHQRPQRKLHRRRRQPQTSSQLTLRQDRPLTIIRTRQRTPQVAEQQTLPRSKRRITHHLHGHMTIKHWKLPSKSNNLTDPNPTPTITPMQTITIQHTTTHTYEAWLPNGGHITYTATLQRPTYQVTPQHLYQAGLTAQRMRRRPQLPPPQPRNTPQQAIIKGQQVTLRPDLLSRLLNHLK